MNDPQKKSPTIGRRDFLNRALPSITALGLGLQARSASALARRLNAPKPIEVCLVSGSVEYKSDESLPAFQEYVEARYPIRCTRAFRKSDEDVPGLEQLDTCDVMLLFTRRLKIDGEQLKRVKQYCTSGRPLVGVRTASHAFQNFLELDKEVLGGNYRSHYANDLPTQIELVAGAQDPPILAGFTPFRSKGSLYRNQGIAADTTLLLNGRIPEHIEPIAWTRMHRGGRVFYTSLGHPDDFGMEPFRQMLAQAVLWSVNKG